MCEPVENGADVSMGQGAHAGGEDASWSLHVDEHGHGGGGYSPNSVDLAVVGVAWVILLISLAMTFRYLFRPGETGNDHIKRRILLDGGPQ